MKIALFNIVFLCMKMGLFAQAFPDIKFNRLTENDGLSSTSVTSVTQDKNGVIWAGTNNGLNRFDGYGFAKFYANPYDSNSINANEIAGIYSDHQDNLWIMTSAGICRFNAITQKATGFKTDTNSPAPFRIYEGSNIWFDKGQQYPYIVSPSALYHFTGYKQYQTISTGFTPFSYKGFSFSSYSKIVEDKNGQLWAFRQNKIFKINENSKKVEKEFDCPKPEMNIFDVVFDSYNCCWVSNWSNVLYRFDPEKNSWNEFSLGNTVKSIIKNGVEWKWNGRKFLVFSIGDPGLLFIDVATLKTHVYPIIGKVGNINAPFVDRQNILWAPTSDGLYYCAPSNQLFDLIPVNATLNSREDSAYECIIYDMSEEKSGYWISRRYDGGILNYDRNWKLEKSWPSVVEGFGPAFDGQLSTIKDGYDFKQMGNLVFVTTEWGMLTINLSTWERKIYQCPWTRSIMRLRTIVPENNQKWWVRSYDQGVFYSTLQRFNLPAITM
ncbi:MAG: hypothetical protein JST13_09850 [Bacteroidetes bacterium]|nr:hypothetical protein [Bacteroidota bacterium]